MSLETFGREWLRVTPRSISNWETFLDVMEVPRSAWTVSGTMPLRSMVSRINSSARSADSARSTVCPTM
ncbi:hypothetical protein AS594_36935 [Streptomyces agglomeratus]|uniref:Uncharacterized protein n=1 Tax=Streptomyces agglomeratus TaxID=285458 RepID=A0A1E5NY52_9ACTN|nr:hypothetical protein AS594_36935 [Streptomyces agglomeratus]